MKDRGRDHRLRRAFPRPGWPCGEATAIVLGVAASAAMILGIPLVFGPNSAMDAYGYLQYDDLTPFEAALSCLAILGPLLIGGMLIVWAVRQQRR